MLPPPTTIPTCTPLRTPPAPCRAIDPTMEGSMPSAAPPAKASPESLRRTLFHCGDWNVTTGSSRTPLWPGSGPYFEAGKALERHTRLVEHLLHRLLVVADVRLVDQHGVLEEPVHAAFDDLRQRLLGLALLACRGLGDAALVVDHVAGHVVTGEVLRAQRGDLHRDASRGLHVVALELHEHADRGRQVARATVHVRRHGAVEDSDAAELELLADHRRERLDVLGDRLAVCECGGEERVTVTVVGCRSVRDDVVRELHELLVLRDEVGLAVELDQGALRGRHQTGAGAALLATPLHLGGVLHAQDLGGLVEVAVGLFERPLGVHHPGAGGIPELLHVSSADRHLHMSFASRRTSSSAVVRVVRRLALLRHWPAEPDGASPGGVASSAGPAGASAAGASAAGASAAGASAAGASAAGAAAAPPPPWSSSRSQSASGSSAPGAVSGFSSPSAAAPARAIRPSATASAMTRVSVATLRIASSLPGIG